MIYTLYQLEINIELIQSKFLILLYLIYILQGMYKMHHREVFHLFYMMKENIDITFEGEETFKIVCNSNVDESHGS